MLPMVAMLVAGYMAKQKGAGAAATAQNAPTAALRPLRPEVGLAACSEGCSEAAAQRAQRASATGGLASMLDMNGDGNPLDDIMRMAGKVVR